MIDFECLKSRFIEHGIDDDQAHNMADYLKNWEYGVHGSENLEIAKFSIAKDFIFNHTARLSWDSGLTLDLQWDLGRWVNINI